MLHSFLYIRMLFFRPRLNILIFPPILGLKYSCIILKLQLMTFPFQNLFGYQLLDIQIDLFALHCLRAPSLFVAVSEVKMSRQTSLGRFGFRTQNDIYPFQNLSLGFILKIFLKFRKFQPRYSYKIYSYKKKSVIKLLQYK